MRTLLEILWPPALGRLALRAPYWLCKGPYSSYHSDIAPSLYRYFSGIARNLDSPCLTIGGQRDHIHALVSLSKNITVAHFAMTVKKESTKWMKSRRGALARFGWQNGYGAFSIGESQVESLQRYIARQEEHHRGITFKEEFVTFLKKYKVAYDAQYIWA